MRGTATWVRLPALVSGLMLALAGCGEDGPAETGPHWPAAAAGPACQLLEYDAVAARLGTRFDTAGGGRKDKTLTCALTQAGNEYPDLILAMTPTSADELIFKAMVAPSGSTVLKGLGRIAYRLEIAAATRRGPGLEIGWLSEGGLLMTLRYTFPRSTPQEQLDELAPKLLPLAKEIDRGLPSSPHDGTRERT